jgi:hypothetical protein
MWRRAERGNPTTEHRYLIGWGHVWCLGTHTHADCHCPRSTVKVKADTKGVGKCSTLQVVGLPEVKDVPEGVLEEGGEYQWPVAMVGGRTTYREQPKEERGRKPGSKNKPKDVAADASKSKRKTTKREAGEGQAAERNEGTQAGAPEATRTSRRKQQLT